MTERRLEDLEPESISQDIARDPLEAWQAELRTGFACVPDLLYQGAKGVGGVSDVTHGSVLATEWPLRNLTGIPLEFYWNLYSKHTLKPFSPQTKYHTESNQGYLEVAPS